MMEERDEISEIYFTKNDEIPVTKKLELVKEMDEEFGKKRKVIVNGLPPDFTEKELRSLIPDQDRDIMCKISDGSARLIFPTSFQAFKAIQDLNRIKELRHERSRLQASYSRPDSLLFIGNIPLWFKKENLRELFSPLGTVLRCLIIYSMSRGLSKGYGFVEFSTRDEALLAKHIMATKAIGGRHLRVDFADNGMQTTADLHSKTLFVDRLPKTFKNDLVLQKMFEVYGTINFCQVAIAPNGCPRCFAFIDFNSSFSAEEAQFNLNGYSFQGQEIRVSYGMPCRPGACILQPKSLLPNLWGMTVQPIVLSNYETLLQESAIYSHVHPIPPPPPPPPPSNGTHSYTAYDYHSHDTHYHHHHHHDSQTVNTPSPPPLPPPPFRPPLTSSVTKTKLKLKIVENVEERKENIMPVYTLLKAGNKRSIHHNSRERSHSSSVYNKPYIGQHDQGIPFTHPLKRIKTGS